MDQQADVVVAETNFGGGLVEANVRAAATELGMDAPPRFRAVRASRGKAVRAAPISTLYETEKVIHAGMFPELEEQLCAFTESGYSGDASPDRADALVWLLSHLFPGLTRPEGRNKGGGLQTEAVRGHSKSKRRY
jgi:phage terminase large subunit-like protein